MKIKSIRGRLLASTIFGGAALALAGPALAAEELVVTGSRIPQQNLVSVSPVAVVGAEEIKAAGITRVEDMINSLPQAFAAQGSNISNAATGTATVNLRGLGSSRTLVLIDGRRLSPGDPAIASQAPDLNFIPSALISRVELDTGGASAVYGADAVAGVVNFIMKRDFEGVRIDGQYGFYNHGQHQRADVVAANKAKSFPLPGDVGSDGAGWDSTLLIGVNAPDGKGNITAYAGYRKNNEILQRDRDFSACTLSSGSIFACGGSGTANPARVGSFVVQGSGAGAIFRPRVAATDIYNFGPTNFFMRPDERYTGGAFAHYELKPWAEVYSDFMFMDDRSVAQIAPGGIFAATFSTNCDNAFMTAQQKTALCGANANTQSNFTGIVARRNVEGGGRQSDLRHTSYRYVIGLRGELGDAFKYDAYAQYSNTTFHLAQTAFFETERISRALIARKDAQGNIVCQSVLDGSDPLCVPYNIFSEGAVTQAMLDYLQTPSFTTGANREWVANASITGKLGQYGIKSPWAMDGVGIAAGVEYRQEALDFDADFVASAGLLNGAGGAAPPVHANFHVTDLFAEARVPLVQDISFLDELSVDLGYRYSSYSTGQKTHTYKGGLSWVPLDGVRFRASYQRAVRAPNILELFSPQVVVLDGTTDPCAGLAASNPLVARCAQAFHLSTAQVLAIEPNPASQYNGLTGGNPILNPEASDTYSWGVVLTPKFARGLTLSVDYFRIHVDHFISSSAGGNADVYINRCLANLDPYFCNLVHRDSVGSLWLSPQGYITDTVLNTGSLGTSGVDIELNYRVNLESVGLSGAGSLSLNVVGTWLNTLTTETLPGDPKFDCTGYYGTVCAVPNPEWRHKARLTWDTPWWGLKPSVQWRYFSSVTLDAFSPDPLLNNPGLQAATDRALGAVSYFDLMASFRPKDAVTVRFGINNLFDKDPPLTGQSNCPAGPCNGNTWAQVYDPLGRRFFFGVTVDF